MPVRKSRLSLGDLMLYLALAAFVLSTYVSRGYPADIPYAVIDCVGLAFLVAYRRLSPWIWVAIVGMSGERPANLISSLISPWWLGRCSQAFLVWAGIGMTLRSAHRRITHLEAQLAIRSAGEAPAGKPVADGLLA